MPVSVSGVTTPPSVMPSKTKIARMSGTGTVIGRPHSAAIETAKIEPDR